MNVLYVRKMPKKFRVPPELATGEAVSLVEPVSSWKLAGDHIEIFTETACQVSFWRNKSSGVNITGYR